jgi:maltokinase
MERTIDMTELEARIRAAGIRALLPAQVAGSFSVDGASAVLDVLPLAAGSIAIVRCAEQILAIPLTDDGALRRAGPGDGVVAALARAIGEGATLGRFAASRFGGAPPGTRERAIEADQSNDSVIVDDAVVVKLSTLPSPAPHPAVELPAHLAEVGFHETPALVGSMTWSGDAGSLLVATATEFLPDARDGWDWHVEVLEEVADGGRPPAAWARPAGALGALVGRLHAALGTASSVFPTPRSLASAEDVAAWRQRSEDTLDEALACTDGPEGERLRFAAPEIRRAFAPFATVTSTPVTPIHGDLHVGQLRPWRDGFAVIDFEGNPLQRSDERGFLRSPARDVASTLRSLDHVGRIVQRRWPERAGDIGSWIAAARTTFLDAYTDALERAGSRDLFDDRLLRPFEVAQECHEFVYAARYLPRWRYVPDLALPALLEA